MDKELVVNLYTDGSCWPNPGGPGGWGFVGVYIKEDQLYTCELYGGEKSSTNNRMELTGLIKGLDFSLTISKDVIIFSDSQYLTLGTGNWQSGLCIEGRAAAWKSNNWRNTSGKVLNIDLWEEVLRLALKFDNLLMNWVRGHSGNKYNEMADKLAEKGRLEWSN